MDRVAFWPSHALEKNGLFALLQHVGPSPRAVFDSRRPHLRGNASILAPLPPGCSQGDRCRPSYGPNLSRSGLGSAAAPQQQHQQREYPTDHALKVGRRLRASKCTRPFHKDPPLLQGAVDPAMRRKSSPNGSSAPTKGKDWHGIAGIADAQGSPCGGPHSP